jgi:hypothetical protein
MKFKPRSLEEPWQSTIDIEKVAFKDDLSLHTEDDVLDILRKIKSSQNLSYEGECNFCDVITKATESMEIRGAKDYFWIATRNLFNHIAPLCVRSSLPPQVYFFGKWRLIPTEELKWNEIVVGNDDLEFLEDYQRIAFRPDLEKRLYRGPYIPTGMLRTSK